MKTKVYATIMIALIFAGCQKELANKQNTISASNADALTDSVYFQGLDVGISDRNAVSGKFNFCYSDFYTVPDSIGDSFKQWKFLVQKSSGVKIDRAKLVFDTERRKFENIVIETRLDTLVIKLIVKENLVPIFYFPTPYHHSVGLQLHATGPIGGWFRVGLVNAEFQNANGDIIPVSRPKAWGPKSVFIR